MNPSQLIALSGQLLGRSLQNWNTDTVGLVPLVPDGSSRRFYRLQAAEPPLIAILPPENDVRGQDEARAFDRIGRHLQCCGSPTPAILAFDETSGLALCEDLGEHRLYEQVQTLGINAALPLYEQAVQGLARMQVRGAQGFDSSWCWDTPVYDRELMLERESRYFLRACCTDLLALDFDREEVEAECRQLAEMAAQAPAQFFLHRDFQSRNIMVCRNAVRFIDFQGGRLGPLAYDLASLLLDPYTQLDVSVQDHLLTIYLQALNQEMAYDSEQFQQEYLLLALQRNLQILGAFAFLSQVKQKPFFAQFLAPALDSLRGLLAKPEAAGYAALNHLCQLCRQKLEHI
ncbi:MAG: phosphotransferase [Desulfobulbus sp.]|nr:phosphotransferase [Desulfobulbus sp.]